MKDKPQCPTCQSLNPGIKQFIAYSDCEPGTKVPCRDPFHLQATEATERVQAYHAAALELEAAARALRDGEVTRALALMQDSILRVDAVDPEGLCR